MSAPQTPAPSGVLTCPVCAGADLASVVAREPETGVAHLACARCGEYVIDDDLASGQFDEALRPRLSGWIRERALLGLAPPRLLPGEPLQQILAQLPDPGVLDKQLRLLRALAARSAEPGHELRVRVPTALALAWARTWREFRFHVRTLVERGLLVATDGRGEPSIRALAYDDFHLALTGAGWERIDADARGDPRSRTAFVGMSFDPALTRLYTEGIAPAIRDAGFDPYRVDRDAGHLGPIDAQVKRMVRSSRFVVADVTGRRPDVYYEAGFAEGLAIPVIWCVRDADRHDIAFNARQHRHVVWASPAALREELRDVILATVGPAP